MKNSKNSLEISARIEINPETLQTIVANAKKQVGPDDKGIYRVDTFAAVSRMITQFLEEKDFRTYVSDMENYRNFIK